MFSKRYSARSMLKYSTAELKDKLSGYFTLIMDDDEIQTSAKETIYSSFFWDFHRKWKDLPLNCNHHLSHYLKHNEEGRITAGFDGKSHIKLLNKIYWDTHAIKNSDIPLIYDDELSIFATQVNNNLYNYLCTLDEYAESFDILDYLEITQVPEVKEYFENIEPTHDGINKGYDLIKHVMKSDDRLNHNPLVRANRAGSIKEMQLLQVIGSRGKVTDIDSYQFKTPITRGYINGFKTIYETLIESRPASQSLFFNKDTLQRSEYFSRRLQIQSMIVERVHPGDCGSNNYISFRLRGENYDTHGRITKKKDTNYFKGKFFLNEETGKLQELKESDEQYIGKVLKFRSPLAGCYHPDPKGICSVCFGALTNSIPKDANIGHLSTAHLMEKISQSILSLKHFQGSALIDKIELTAGQSRFFKTNKKANSYILKEIWNDKNLKMVVPKAEITGITDINIVEDVEELGSITRISEISNISMIVTEDGASEIIPLDIGIGKRRKGSLTREFLEFIKEKGWSYDAKGNYVFSLNEWDSDDPIIVLPDIHANTSDLLKKIEDLIESRKTELESRNTNAAILELLEELHTEVNNVLDINIALLEIIIFGGMVRDNARGDFNLPKGADRKALGVSKITINRRSLGAAMGYENQSATMVNPLSFFNENRPSHVMDVFLKPKEAVEDFYKPRWV